MAAAAFVAFNFVLTGRLLLVVVPGPESLARRNLKLAGAGYANEDHDASGSERSARKTAPSPRRICTSHESEELTALG
jgi:hypothetical protein